MNPIEQATIPLHMLSYPLSAEDQARADLYALVATLLLRPPDATLLSALACADSLASLQEDNPLDLAWEELILAARLMETDAVRDEFDALFISPGMPLVNPYGSLYLAGFMMEKPLAALRAELAALGLGRAPGAGESEDHLGALCEAMHVLITGPQGVARRTVQEQKGFFIRHIAPWYGRCLEDIRSAESANFYRHVADFAQAFFDVEVLAFEMEDVVDG
ncbi:TorD/DmsD family molecular chaperone [Noviherbaspirillum sp.]|uniref:TorD/DmsD family molecular chaperone n=1 Tax=Noviherbaspirillum sp. TaxID=1926288 RepID=UPI002FDFD4B3